MRVLIVHNAYLQAGGEDVVANAETELLARHGHATMRLDADNRAIAGVRGIVRAAVACTYSVPARERIADSIRRFRPDVVHVHNFFPQFSPSIYDACQSAGVPVVQTLHNYRLICPGALLMRDGAVCEKCVRGNAYRSVRHGCYRGSPAATLAVARMVETHRRRKTWHEQVDRFVALTGFAKAKFIEGGLPASRITVKANSLTAEPAESQPTREDAHNALFVGRLSVEKGVQTLAAAWCEAGMPQIKILGEGPLRGAFDVVERGVTLLGHRSASVVREEMDAAAFIVMPSICYEGFPMVVLEAFAHARPIIASRIGALAELVHDGETGLLCEPGNPGDLAAKVRWAAAHAQAMRSMGLRARDVFERNYTAAANYRNLMAIYRSVGA